MKKPTVTFQNNKITVIKDAVQTYDNESISMLIDRQTGNVIDVGGYNEIDNRYDELIEKKPDRKLAIIFFRLFWQLYEKYRKTPVISHIEGEKYAITCNDEPDIVSTINKIASQEPCMNVRMLNTEEAKNIEITHITSQKRRPNIQNFTITLENNAVTITRTIRPSLPTLVISRKSGKIKYAGKNRNALKKCHDKKNLVPVSFNVFDKNQNAYEPNIWFYKSGQEYMVLCRDETDIVSTMNRIISQDPRINIRMLRLTENDGKLRPIDFTPIENNG